MRPTFTANLTFRTPTPESIVTTALADATTIDVHGGGVFTATQEGVATNVGDAESRSTAWLTGKLALHGVDQDEFTIHDITIFLGASGATPAKATE